MDIGKTLLNLRAEPVPGYKFQVFINNIRMGFSRVTNLEESIETEPLQEGGVNDRTYSLRAPVTAEDRRTAVSSHTGQAFVDQGDYLPPRNYRTGPVPQGLTHSQAQGGVPAQAPVQRPVNNPVSRPTAQPSRNQGEASPAAQRRQAAQRVASQGSGAAAPQAGQVQRRVTAVQEGAPVPQRRTAPPLTPRQRPAQVVRPGDIPDVTEDFFKKYDDPAYVERRLKELEQGKKDR